MKKITITLIAMIATLCVMAQTKFWVYNNDGTQTEFLISKVDSISFTEPSAPTSEKCKASDYPQVTIGTQTWMVENYRCSKYDTESEAYNASWLTNNTIPTSDIEEYTPYYTEVYTPYYIDASDKSKWDSYSKQYGVNLTEAQIAKLGYLYNWAAAVGVENGAAVGVEDGIELFSSKRQGICPNGWHLPSRAEWQMLYDYIYKDKSLTSKIVGKYLKTTSGWYNGGNGFDIRDGGNGFDSYGFEALPAGDTVGNGVSHVGYDTSFSTATPGEGGGVYNMYLFYNSANLSEGFDLNQCIGISVRCLRN